MHMDVEKISGNTLSVIVDGRNRTFHAAEEDARCFVSVDGSNYSFTDAYKLEDESGMTAAEAAGGGEVSGNITADMPGKILKIPVEEGQEVEEGTTLIILESMKMENSIKSPLGGTVAKVHVREGDQVKLADALLDIEPAN